MARRRPGLMKQAKKYLLYHHGPVCMKCWKVFSEKELQVDHIIPLSKRGSNRKENLQLLCGPCNQEKGVKTEDHKTGRAKLGKFGRAFYRWRTQWEPPKQKSANNGRIGSQMQSEGT